LLVSPPTATNLRQSHPGVWPAQGSLSFIFASTPCRRRTFAKRAYSFLPPATSTKDEMAPSRAKSTSVWRHALHPDAVRKDGPFFTGHFEQLCPISHIITTAPCVNSCADQRPFSSSWKPPVNGGFEDCVQIEAPKFSFRTIALTIFRDEFCMRVDHFFHLLFPTPNRFRDEASLLLRRDEGLIEVPATSRDGSPFCCSFCFLSSSGIYFIA